MTNLFEHTSADWAKYSVYEWRKAADGREYLLPTADAAFSVYNPVALADQLVLDAVNAGLLTFHQTPDEKKIRDAIHSFVSNYGLLGMMTALPTTSKFVEYEKVYLLKNQFIREESMETLDYMKLFFPFQMPDFRKKGVESVWNVSASDRAEALLALRFQDESQAMAMSFMRGYGEPLDWLKEVFRDWAFTFLTISMYYQKRDLLDKNTRDLYRSSVACFDGNTPTYHLDLRDHPVMMWDFHSLMLAVKFLFSVGLTDEKNPMKMCRYCCRAFYAQRQDAQYCSAECRNKANKKP